MAYIPYGRQSISRADVAAVVEVLNSDFLTQGPAVGRFEQAIADYCQARHACAVSNATAALHLACLAVGVGPGDTVWTSPITFVASANCARYCGAEVAFIDIDPGTRNISVDALARELASAEAGHRAMPRAIIAVHFAGESCDMQALAALASRYDVRLIEDASHALGGRYQQMPVGSCQFSDVCVFSLHPVKIITSGEGGLVLTNDDAIAEQVMLLRTHGIRKSAELAADGPDEPWYYEQHQLGFNYRMTDIQAALGHSQLQRLDEFVDARQRLAERYDHLLTDSPVSLPPRDAAQRSALHLYPVVLNDDAGDGVFRAQVFRHLRAHDIGVNVHYIPVYRQPYYASGESERSDCPAAEAYYSGALSLPLFPALTGAEQSRVVSVLLDGISVARHQCAHAA